MLIFVFAKAAFNIELRFNPYNPQPISSLNIQEFWIDSRGKF